MILMQTMFFFLIWGFFHFRPYTIVLLLNLEGLVLLCILLIILNYYSNNLGMISMSFLSMVVLEATLGLCILTLLMRFFEKEEFFFLNFLQF